MKVSDYWHHFAVHHFSYILHYVQRDLDYVYGRDINHVVYSQYAFMYKKIGVIYSRPRGCFDSKELCKILLNPCYTNVRRYSVTCFIFY